MEPEFDKRLGIRRFNPKTVHLANRSYLQNSIEGAFPSDGLAELFHENSKYTHIETKLSESGQAFEEESIIQTVSNIAPDHRGLEFIELPWPDDDGAIEHPLGHVLEQRRTVRSFTGDPISKMDLSRLLLNACGTAGHLEVDRALDRLRTYPSPGALYPVEMYVALLHGRDIESGLYYYSPDKHGLRVLKTSSGGIRSEVAELFPVPKETLEIEATSAVIFLTGTLPRVKAKYGPRGYRFMLQESGHIAQNIQLVATALGYGAAPIGGYYDREVNDWLGLDGIERSALYTVYIGVPDVNANG